MAIGVNYYYVAIVTVPLQLLDRDIIFLRRPMHNGCFYK